MSVNRLITYALLNAHKAPIEEDFMSDNISVITLSSVKTDEAIYTFSSDDEDQTVNEVPLTHNDKDSWATDMVR